MPYPLGPHVCPPPPPGRYLLAMTSALDASQLGAEHRRKSLEQVCVCVGGGCMCACVHVGGGGCMCACGWGVGKGAWRHLW